MLANPRFRILIYVFALISAVSVYAAVRLNQHAERLDREGMVLARTESISEKGSVVDILSGKYPIHGYFQSMQGPSSNLPQIRLSESARKNDVIWVTGVESEVVDAMSQTTISPEFFCHANLTLSPDSTTPEAHCASFATPKHQDWRLFTLVPGRMEIDLPAGFGIPLRAATELDFYSMSLNQNPDRPAPGEIRFKSRIRFDRSSNEKAMRPVFRRALYVYQQFQELEDKSSSAAAETIAELSKKHVGEQCAKECEKNQLAATPSRFAAGPADHPGATCCVANASKGGLLRQFGPEHTIHWMVPPGQHTYRSEVTDQFELPFDTTAHYVTGHLHPYGVSLELIEMESGEVVFSIESEDFDDRVGVRLMTELKSERGVWLEKDARYELVAKYDNPTEKPSDAMAILYLYLAEEPEISEKNEERGN